MNKILILGPEPPAIGGIATIIQLLKNNFVHNSEVVFVSTNKPSPKLFKVIHPLFLFFRILLKVIAARNSTVLMFSSAYMSFWEKCAWSMLCKLFGLRTVMLMVDGNFPDFFSGMSKPIKMLALIMMKNVDVLAVQSNQWGIFYKNIFPFTKIKIVSPGIDTDFFQPAKKHSKNHPLNILYVGWLIEDKGLYDLLHAVEIVKNHGVKYKLILLGPAFGQKKIILDYAVKHKIDHLIEIAGSTSSRNEVREAYHSADIFVFPSHYEGFPYALMEAVSCGLPCIGTRVGGIPDILDDGKCGVLVNRKDPEELASKLMYLINDEQHRTKFSKEARLRAIREYSLLKSFTDFKDVLNFKEQRNLTL